MEPTGQWLLEQCLPPLIAKHVASSHARDRLEAQIAELQAKLDEWCFITVSYRNAVDNLRDAIHREGIAHETIRIACNAIYTRENARHDQSNGSRPESAAGGI